MLAFRQPFRDRSLSRFFDELEIGDVNCVKRWDAYLDHLAIIVSNLRMAFDCDIFLGGHVGGFMGGHMRTFGDKIRKYNNFEVDTSYIHLGQYKRECASIGAARQVIDRYIGNLKLDEESSQSR